jgi:hypothetical protein
MSKKIIFFLLLILPITVKADCTDKELARYKILASYINYYTEFNESNKTFDITLYNLSNELTLETQNQKYSSQEKMGETKITNKPNGENIKISVYPKNGACNNYSLRTMYINLPKYNKYHEEEICKNNNSILCSKWANTSSYTKEQFEIKVKKETQQEEKQETQQEENKSIFDFLAEYYVPILLALLIIIITTKYLIERKKRFKF